MDFKNPDPKLVAKIKAIREASDAAYAAQKAEEAARTQPERLEELSKKTLGRYVNKASTDAKHKGYSAGYVDGGDSVARGEDRPWRGEKDDEKAFKRLKGVRNAVDRLVHGGYTKEEAERMAAKAEELGLTEELLDELSKGTLGSYVKKAADSMAINHAKLHTQRKDAEEVDRFTNRNGMADKYAMQDKIKQSLGADNKSQEKSLHNVIKRVRGIEKAADRLAKEEVEVVGEGKITSGFSKPAPDAKKNHEAKESAKKEHEEHRKEIEKADFEMGRSKKLVRQLRKEDLDALMTQISKDTGKIEEGTHAIHITKNGKDHGKVMINAIDDKNAEWQAKRLIGQKPYRGYEIAKVVRVQKEEVEVVDEAKSEKKKDFEARQGRIDDAVKAMDPAKLERMKKIPGFTAAMDLAKKTVKEEEEVLDEACKEHEVHVAPHSSGHGFVVKAVGKKFADGIKVGEKLTDTHLDDVTEMGGKIKHVKEETFAEGVEDDARDHAIRITDKRSYKSKGTLGKANKRVEDENASDERDPAWMDANDKHQKFYDKAYSRVLKVLKKEEFEVGDDMTEQEAMELAAFVAEEMTKVEEVIEEGKNTVTPAHSWKYNGRTYSNKSELAHTMASHWLDRRVYTNPKANVFSRNLRTTGKIGKAYQRLNDRPTHKAKNADNAAKAEHDFHMKAHRRIMKVLTKNEELQMTEQEVDLLFAEGLDTSGIKVFENDVELNWLDEMAKRGRPRKNPLPAGAEEAGPEADQHIIMQLRKAENMDDKGGKKEVEFKDGKKHVIPSHVAKTVLAFHEKLKPESKSHLQDMISKSHKHLMDVHSALTAQNKK